jgi:hypothetical membrane protein
MLLLEVQNGLFGALADGKLPEGFNTSMVLVSAAAVWLLGTLGLCIIALTRGFDERTLTAFVLVFFIPAMVMVLVDVKIGGEAVTGLLGTVAGYLLSRGQNAARNNPPKDKASEPGGT